MPLLETRNLTLTFGGLVAVSKLSLKIEEGELLGLIGPNGAGKTTVFNLITGLYGPDAGDIIFQGKSIQGLKPHAICRLGISRTFQNIRLFSHLSVLDNLRVAYQQRLKTNLMEAVLDTFAHREEEKEAKRAAEELLKALGLEHVQEQPASALPYGEQRRGEIARALMTRPRLLLLDEPAAGMNPAEKKQLMEMIRWVRDHYKVTILLIEHDMTVVMNICHRIVVMDYGIAIAEGPPEKIRKDPAVIEAYLGTTKEDA